MKDVQARAYFLKPAAGTMQRCRLNNGNWNSRQSHMPAHQASSPGTGRPNTALKHKLVGWSTASSQSMRPLQLLSRSVHHSNTCMLLLKRIVPALNACANSSGSRLKRKILHSVDFVAASLATCQFRLFSNAAFSKWHLQSVASLSMKMVGATEVHKLTWSLMDIHGDQQQNKLLTVSKDTVKLLS